jgi:hypothetical protein
MVAYEPKPAVVAVTLRGYRRCRLARFCFWTGPHVWMMVGVCSHGIPEHAKEQITSDPRALLLQSLCLLRKAV